MAAYSRTLTLGVITAASVLAVAFVGLLVYLAMTFALMRSHAPLRSSRAAVAALFREAAWIAVTQPLLPVFYVLGGRFARGARGIPVVLVHGYMHNRIAFVGLGRALARRGIGPLFAINYPWFATVPSNAQRLRAFITRVLAETGAPQVDLVCHSMGGVIAVELLRQDAAREASTVRRCVTIASPHAGVMWRGPTVFDTVGLRAGSELLRTHAEHKLGIPFLSIYSSHDNVVYPRTTSSLVARGGRDLEVPELAHFSLLFSPSVADATATFLKEADPAQAARPIDSNLPSRTS